MAQTASDILIGRLIEWGVKEIFGLPGDGINGIMEALRKRQGGTLIVAITTTATTTFVKREMLSRFEALRLKRGIARASR